MIMVVHLMFKFYIIIKKVVLIIIYNALEIIIKRKNLAIKMGNQSHLRALSM